MAEKNSSNDGQYFLASSQNETDKVDSDMDAAARQCASTKKKTYFQPEVRSRKTSENTIPQKQRLSNNPGKKWNKFPQAGVSRKHDGEFRTITMKKGKQCRLRTALKLLDILEGKYDDSDSECSLDSKSLHRSVKRSTRRLQAMRDDHTPRDFIGLCRDCRSRCRNCGRRPSAVLMARRKRY
ncbi:uncharacterized protein LOC6614471 [Drosophila sechellia]|uniref:uncharacterized protein LOC6614471 n=1 Tax=Drosophila sechellia TaxID=7238 RepID=UPI0013DE5B98|nr:uncharacterized protein LOC6614471 [Drosophila sechellia]